jgi:hypothetical protein
MRILFNIIFPQLSFYAHKWDLRSLSRSVKMTSFFPNLSIGLVLLQIINIRQIIQTPLGGFISPEPFFTMHRGNVGLDHDIFWHGDLIDIYSQTLVYGTTTFGVLIVGVSNHSSSFKTAIT